MSRMLQRLSSMEQLGFQLWERGVDTDLWLDLPPPPKKGLN